MPVSIFPTRRNNDYKNFSFNEQNRQFIHGCVHVRIASLICALLQLVGVIYQVTISFVMVLEKDAIGLDPRKNVLLSKNSLIAVSIWGAVYVAGIGLLLLALRQTKSKYLYLLIFIQSFTVMLCSVDLLVFSFTAMEKKRGTVPKELWLVALLCVIVAVFVGYSLWLTNKLRIYLSERRKYLAGLVEEQKIESGTSVNEELVDSKY